MSQLHTQQRQGQSALITSLDQLSGLSLRSIGTSHLSSSLPEQQKPTGQAKPFCSRISVSQGTLKFLPFHQAHDQRSLTPIMRSRLGGEKVGVYSEGTILHARIGRHWAIVPATHNRFDHSHGSLRFVAAATNKGGGLFGAFVLNDGHNLFSTLCFVAARNKDGSLFGENRTNDPQAVNWLQRQFKIHTPSVLWPVARGTFHQTARNYTTFRDDYALLGCHLSPLSPTASENRKTISLERVDRANCASGYPEEAIVLRIGAYNLPLPGPNTFFAGWVRQHTVYIAREQQTLTVALYDISNPSSTQPVEYASYLIP